MDAHNASDVNALMSLGQNDDDGDDVDVDDGDTGNGDNDYDNHDYRDDHEAVMACDDEWSCDEW